MVESLKYNTQIDAVITWVDGNDERHKKNVAFY